MTILAMTGCLINTAVYEERMAALFGGDLANADGDRFDGLPAGGDDCDDGDALVYAGASEAWADGFTDNDCDGELEAVVLEFGAEAWSGSRAGDYLGRRTGALGDADGDGLGEVLVGSEYDSTLGANSGAIYALDGAPGGTIDAGRALFPDVAGGYFASDVDAGRDVTGDGVYDVVVGTPGSAEEPGSAWLVSGAAWAAAGDASVGDVSVGLVRGSGPGTYGPASVRLVGDVTGDGVPDVALSECCGTSAGASTYGRVAIFSADAFEGTIEDADMLIDGPWEGAYMGGQLDPVGDQDGDGLADLAFGGANGLAAVVAPRRRAAT